MVHKWRRASLFGPESRDSAAAAATPSGLAAPAATTTTPTGVRGAAVAVRSDRSSRELDPGNSPRRHAERLLSFLQEDGDKTGLVPAAEIVALYGALMRDLGWQACGWNRVAKHLAAMTGAKRHVDVVDGGIRRRVLHYDIPIEGLIVSPVQRARRDGAPLTYRLAQLEATNAALAERVAEMSALIRQVLVRPHESRA